MGGTPQAFLSYTRLDDEGHDGGITALRAALELQVRIVTGDDGFEIFQDFDGIAFGEHWPKRLDQALATCRFLIPVLSPRFFKSKPCRDELRKFLAHEQAAGRDDLILPIYLVEAPVLERPHLTAADELAAAIAQRQRWDWRPHAFASAGDPAQRQAVRRLANAIAERLDGEVLRPLDRAIQLSLASITSEPLASTQSPISGNESSPSANPKPDLPPSLTTRRIPKLMPGSVFRDVEATWCPELVVIPAGRFVMGSPSDELGRLDNEDPQREVTFAQPFALGRYSVTFAEWDAFVAEGGCKYRPGDQGWGRERQPVINVSWKDAQSYVAWLSAMTGQPYRLPTEAEWEYAARAGTTAPFWTGATISTAQANYDGDHIYGTGKQGMYRKRTVRVEDSNFPANPFGLYHMLGNVWEWVQDSHCASYVGASMSGSIAVEAAEAPERVLRGGSWDCDPRNLRSSTRGRFAPEYWDVNVGFRVARALFP